MAGQQTAYLILKADAMQKCIDLSEEKEPEIYQCHQARSIGGKCNFLCRAQIQIDFHSKTITENTRVSYPLHFISNALEPSIGNTPKNIFFLTADAYGVLPPVSKLTAGQAMYQFISGYTAKVAGTEAGVTEPKSTFSACFGAPFLPLHPGKYAEMLGKKMKETQCECVDDQYRLERGPLRHWQQDETVLYPGNDHCCIGRQVG